jgi:MFS family permease
MKDSFNADFYATAATVIPVLYLALAVQGSTLDTVLTRLYGVEVRKGMIIGGWTAKQNKGRRSRCMGAYVTAFGLAASLIYGLIGEAIAILALYHRQSSPGQAQWVLISVIILVALIAVVTCVRLVPTVFKVLSMGMRDRRDRKRADKIASGSREARPMTRGDYRAIFGRLNLKTREDAERFAEQMIDAFRGAELVRIEHELGVRVEDDKRSLAVDSIRLPVEDDIRKALDEAFPLLLLHGLK